MYSIYSLTFKPTCQIQLCPNWFFCVILARTYGLLYCIYVISIVTQYYGMAVPGPVELLVYLKLSALWDISGTMSNELGNPNITYCELCTAGYYCSGTNNTNVTGPCLTIAISVLFHESLSLNVFSYVYVVAKYLYESCVCESLTMFFHWICDCLQDLVMRVIIARLDSLNLHRWSIIVQWDIIVQ